MRSGGGEIRIFWPLAKKTRRGKRAVGGGQIPNILGILKRIQEILSADKV